MSKVVGSNDDFLLCKQQYVRRRLKVNAQKGSETIVLFKVTSSKAKYFSAATSSVLLQSNLQLHSSEFVCVSILFQMKSVII